MNTGKVYTVQDQVKRNAHRGRRVGEIRHLGKAGDTGEELNSEFPAGFRHPFHDHLVFNMSDPLHAMKKIANALWQGAIPGRKVELDTWRVKPENDKGEMNDFSLKTAERVYNSMEMGTGETPAESVASLQIILI